MSQLMLTDNIPLNLMIQVMKGCQIYQNMELSHFNAEIDDMECQLVAHYPGNGHLVGVNNVVYFWPSVETLGIAKTVARDLNTIFGLEDPNC